MREWTAYVRERLGLSDLRPEHEAEITEEIARQLEDAYEEALRQGLDEKEAEAAAAAHVTDWVSLSAALRESPTGKIPALDRLAERAAERRAARAGMLGLFVGVWHDVLYGLRLLAKNRGFAAAAILTMAIAIGANTAVFSILKAALFSFPYSQPDRIVVASITSPPIRRTFAVPFLLDAIYETWEKRNRSFSAMTAYQVWRATLIGVGPPEMLPAASVTPGFFRMLGVQPMLGRAFHAGEGGPGQPTTAILSNRFWRVRFASSPKVIGRTIRLDGLPLTVVGVMPASFEFPEEGGPDPDVLLPLNLSNASLNGKSFAAVQSLGRLQPGIGLEEARANLEVILRQDENESRELRKFLAHSHAVLVPLRERLLGSSEPALLALWGAVGFLLLIACVNVANLTLARGLAREREIAVRVALGAHRRRVARQLLTENMLIASLGAMAGLALAYGAVVLVRQLGPANLPGLRDTSIDLPVLAFTALLAALAGAFAGLAPAHAAWRVPTVEALKEGSRSSAGRGQRRLRNALMVAEIAMALVLAIGSGLLVRSFLRITSIDLGFDPHNVLTAEIAHPPYTGSVRRNRATNRRLADLLLERLRSLPQVVSAAVAAHSPMSGFLSTGHFRIAGQREVSPALEPRYMADPVSGGYFRTMGIPIIAGRGFEPRDVSPTAHVAVVNEVLVHRYFPPGDPIGQQIVIGKKEYRVVGVVGNVRQLGLLDEPFPTIFWDYARYPSSISLVIRTTGNPLVIVPTLRAQLQSIDNKLPVFNVATMEERLGKMEDAHRFETVVLGIFALVALVLAALGVYGVISYSVNERTHEIGIRMALGADKGTVMRMVVGKTLALALVGVAIGIGGAYGLTRYLQSMLYHISPDDPWAFTLAAAVLFLAALLAGCFPARRAMGIDPVTALREE